MKIHSFDVSEIIVKNHYNCFAASLPYNSSHYSSSLTSFLKNLKKNNVSSIFKASFDDLARHWRHLFLFFLTLS